MDPHVFLFSFPSFLFHLLCFWIFGLNRKFSILFKNATNKKRMLFIFFFFPPTRICRRGLVRADVGTATEWAQWSFWDLSAGGAIISIILGNVVGNVGFDIHTAAIMERSIFGWMTSCILLIHRPFRGTYYFRLQFQRLSRPRRRLHSSSG
jgi:hypothetical protein